VIGNRIAKKRSSYRSIVTFVSTVPCLEELLGGRIKNGISRMRAIFGRNGVYRPKTSRVQIVEVPTGTSRILPRSESSRTCVNLTRQVDGSQTSVAASLRQVDGSQSSRLRGVKSTVKNGTIRRRGFSNWRRVAVARDAPLWSAPGRRTEQAESSITIFCSIHAYFWFK
jgi:hypothetical protein